MLLDTIKIGMRVVVKDNWRGKVRSRKGVVLGFGASNYGTTFVRVKYDNDRRPCYLARLEQCEAENGMAQS